MYLLFATTTWSLPPWQASWIWADSDADMLLARKSFELDTVPEAAEIRITASSIYKLYINGQYVGRGPARSAPHHQSFDTHDIRSLLVRGQNTIAARVHYQKGTIAYHHQGRPGLFAQLDMHIDGTPSVVTTDADWLVLPDPSWNENSPLMSRFHLEVCDRVDLRQNPGDWTGRVYDDSEWLRAKPLIREVGWPGPQRNARPQALTPPWTLFEQRDIPYLAESDVVADKLIQAQQIRGQGFSYDKDVKETPSLVQAVALTRSVDPKFNKDNINNWFLLYDLGTAMNGMPYLDIQGPAGTVVDVMCAPYVVDDKFSAHVFDSILIDRIILTGGSDEWEAAYFKPTRYLALVVRGPAGRVKLNEAGLHRIAYPFELRGRFETPENTWFEDLWQAAAKTIEVCTTDAYTDNYRERRQYVQTGYYAALGNYYTFGDTALQRRFLKQAADEQEANGLMPAYAPRHGDDFMVILDSNTAWIRGLRNYFLYSGDEETVRELLPAAQKLMAFLHRYTNEDGLLDSPPYAYWLDHAIQDRRGANLCMNGHYHGALKDFADVLDWLKEPGADSYRQQAERIRKTVQEKFWNPKLGLFVDALIDGKRSPLFSEHGNAMALAMGAATKKQAESVAAHLLKDDDSSFIKRESGMTMVTPAMSYFLHKGLCDYGYVEQSLSLMQRRFDRMLDPETNQTLWEEWWRDGTGRTGEFQKRTRSDAQTESAFPPALFGEFILGTRPKQPGMRLVELRVPQCGLNQISGAIPSPLGNLEVQWNLHSREVKIVVPKGMRVRPVFETSTSEKVLNEGIHELRY